MPNSAIQYSCCLSNPFKGKHLLLNLSVNFFSGSMHSSHWIELLPPSDLLRSVQIILLSADMCNVWVCGECHWSAWLKDSVTNIPPHTAIWAYTTASKRRRRRLEFHICPSCLDFSPDVCLCLNVFKQGCLCVWVCVFGEGGGGLSTHHLILTPGSCHWILVHHMTHFE